MEVPTIQVSSPTLAARGGNQGKFNSESQSRGNALLAVDAVGYAL